MELGLEASTSHNLVHSYTVKNCWNKRGLKSCQASRKPGVDLVIASSPKDKGPLSRGVTQRHRHSPICEGPPGEQTPPRLPYEAQFSNHTLAGLLYLEML